ncbi:hypothetical protein GYMLUDRAFT_58414 [Collybiopsis luxurians FD-317 M1]|uniref:Uncharacterized protein n=1 Tax=Collybiopsis luxurians FD-317 M1 TaxID=944289 RepID=A0A0D0C299_9AGAR|nr:hypothetical protein GYMLUDRAFT_58414 [Collybiopsis luxurians FD-317 M1]
MDLDCESERGLSPSGSTEQSSSLLLSLPLELLLRIGRFIFQPNCTLTDMRYQNTHALHRRNQIYLLNFMRTCKRLLAIGKDSFYTYMAFQSLLPLEDFFAFYIMHGVDPDRHLQGVRYLYFGDSSKCSFIPFHWPLIRELLISTNRLQVLTLHKLNLDHEFFAIVSGLPSSISLKIGWCMIDLDNVDFRHCQLAVHTLHLFNNKWVHLVNPTIVYSYELLFVCWCSSLKKAMIDFSYRGDYGFAAAGTVIGFSSWPTTLQGLQFKTIAKTWPHSKQVCRAMLLCMLNLANKCQQLAYFSIGPVVPPLSDNIFLSTKHLTLPSSLVPRISLHSTPTTLDLMFGEEIDFAALSAFPVLQSVTSANLALSNYSHALIRGLLLQFPCVKSLVLRSIFWSKLKTCIDIVQEDLVPHTGIQSVDICNILYSPSSWQDLKDIRTFLSQTRSNHSLKQLFFDGEEVWASS